MDNDQISKLEIPTGNPLLMELNGKYEIKNCGYLDKERAKDLIEEKLKLEKEINKHKKKVTKKEVVKDIKNHQKRETKDILFLPPGLDENSNQTERCSCSARVCVSPSSWFPGNNKVTLS